MASVMTQSVVVFSMICAIIFLSSRYTYWQVWGAIVILGGTFICLFANGFQGTGGSNSAPVASPAFSPSSGSSSLDSGVINSFQTVLYSSIMFFSPLPNAVSFTLKEMVFVYRPKLDIFVVNSSGSLFQLVLWPLFLPLTLLFDQTGGEPFGEYLKNGFLCFAGQYKFAPGSPYDCSSMPWPFVVYIVFNLAFNISLLLLLKRASALQAFMATKGVLPVSFLLFYFKWPLIPSSSINIFIITGLFIILFGLVMYRLATLSKDTHKKQKEYDSCCAFHFSISCKPTSARSNNPTIN